MEEYPENLSHEKFGPSMSQLYQVVLNRMPLSAKDFLD
jgi:hypothetical protein